MAASGSPLADCERSLWSRTGSNWRDDSIRESVHLSALARGQSCIRQSWHAIFCSRIARLKQAAAKYKNINTQTNISARAIEPLAGRPLDPPSPHSPSRRALFAFGGRVNPRARADRWTGSFRAVAVLPQNTRTDWATLVWRVSISSL